MKNLIRSNKLDSNSKEGDMSPFKEVKKGDDINILENAVLDEDENKFIEKKQLIEKKNKDKIKALKEGIRVAAIKIDNYKDNIERFYKSQPFFYDDVGIFWFWNIEQDKWVIVDEIDIMNSIEDRYHFQGMTVPSLIKRNYLEAFKRVGRKKKPKNAPIKWIQFKDKAYSINSSVKYTVTPDYFFVNPIPWELGESPETPIMDKLFEEWVGKAYVQTLYELIAYCCYRDYPIQTIFCLYGTGRNGKGQFQKVVNKFFGNENVCSTELDVLLDSRFEAFKLYKKLICAMGETNFGVIKRTSLLKKLVGGDLIGYEKKGKDPFDELNYAKIIISSNSLPSSDDTSDGFMRRWLIIDFPNEFPEGKDIIKTIPEHEYNNLALKVTKILPKLLESGKFKNQGTIKERKEKYILASNPVSIFIRQCCDIDESEFESYNKLYTAYVQFLKVNKKRRVKLGEFKSALESEGYWIERTSKKDNDTFKSGNWVNGIRLKDNLCNYVNYVTKLSQNCYRGDGVKTLTQFTQLHKIEDIEQEINLPCHICGEIPSHFFDDMAQGKPICKVCNDFKVKQKETGKAAGILSTRTINFNIEHKESDKLEDKRK